MTEGLDYYTGLCLRVSRARGVPSRRRGRLSRIGPRACFRTARRARCDDGFPVREGFSRVIPVTHLFGSAPVYEFTESGCGSEKLTAGLGLLASRLRAAPSGESETDWGVAATQRRFRERLPAVVFAARKQAAVFVRQMSHWRAPLWRIHALNATSSIEYYLPGPWPPNILSG